jgi:hypothetical protein
LQLRKGRILATSLFAITWVAAVAFGMRVLFHLRRSAAAIPGVKVLFDPDRMEARRFGAETSGHNLSFGADGGLLFSGGITASRGHAGESVRERAIVAPVNNQTPARTQTWFLATPSLTAPRRARTQYV